MKNSKEFCFVVVRQYTSKFAFLLQHRLFNFTPDMLEVGHPKRSYVHLMWKTLSKQSGINGAQA